MIEGGGRQRRSQDWNSLNVTYVQARQRVYIGKAKKID